MSETERLVRLLYADLQRIAVDDGDGVIGVEKVAEGGGAALFGEGAFNAVAGDAQRQAADLRFIVADIAAVPLDDELGVGRAEAEHRHPAAVGGDLDGGGAALKADGLGLFIGDIIGVALFDEAAVGHDLDAVVLARADGLHVVELLGAALDADDEIFLHGLFVLRFRICRWRSAPPGRPCTRRGRGRPSAQSCPACR